MDEDDSWDRFARWPLTDRFELLAFEAELAGLPRPLIVALWDAIDELGGPGPRTSPEPFD